jgi:hypothetical protein
MQNKHMNTPIQSLSELKNLLFIIVLSIVSFHSLAIQNYTTGQALNVLASSGMNLRDAPKGTVLQKIPYGARVKALHAKSNANAETVEGIKGNWVKVEYNGATGFLFDGFLSALPVPELNGANLLAYTQRAFDKLSSQLPINYIEDSNGPAILSTQLFQAGKDTVVYFADQYYEGLTEFISIPNISLEEGYLLIRALFAEWYSETSTGLQSGTFAQEDFKPEALNKFVLNGSVYRQNEAGADIELPGYYYCPLGSGCSYEITIRMHENRVFISAGGGC